MGGHYGEVMDPILTAVLSGTVIGAIVTGLFSLAKPWIDFWVAALTRRWSQKLERRAVVEGVVEQLRKLRVMHQLPENRHGVPYELVLQASDSALLIDDQEFGKYLSQDIENTAGFSWLFDWKANNEKFDGEPNEAAREARWNHLKKLVARASAFAVTGKWEKAWASEAATLSQQMYAASEAISRNS